MAGNVNQMINGKERLIDFISGQEVPATPEEKYATQPFSRILVEDYGYGKSDIQTRPQYRVKAHPSDMKGYPIDIAVFENGKLKLIVECKAPKIRQLEDRLPQLKTYLLCSEAEIGVVYNGEDSIYIRKVQTEDGIDFEKIPFIPHKGEKISEIGLYKKVNLMPSHNLKSVFSEIRGWIVANGNVTRDDEIAAQMMLLILCKIYDERFTEKNSNLEFRASLDDTDEEIEIRIKKLFKATKGKYNDVILNDDEIKFDGNTLRGILGRLQKYSIVNTDRDCIADAFEVFVGKSVKEKEGQYFTPRNVIHTMIAAINLKTNSYIIDSACGSGGFLVESLKRLEDILKEKAIDCDWSEAAYTDEVKEQAIKYLRGLEKDPFLTKLSKSYMAILGDGKGGIFREDSLEQPSKWSNITQQQIKLGMFDFLLANPPFGKNIKVEGKEKLKQYSLAKRTDQKGQTTINDSGIVSSLFLERNLQLLKSGTNTSLGGKMGIILPEPYFALNKYSAEMDMMIKGNNILWIIDLPQNTFRPHNNAKCCAIIFQKDAPQQEYINMAVIDNIGHNHQGKAIYNLDGTIKDDCEQVIKEIGERNQNGGTLITDYANQRTFRIKADKVLGKRILIPRFYRDECQNYIEELADIEDYRLISLRKLIDEGIIDYFSGHGSPEAESKGMGDIPYIRVKDIVNWQTYVDVTAMVTEETYNKLYNPNKQLRPKDILYVSRGSYRIGSVAMVSPYDGKMLLTREIIVIRINENNKYGITPEYLLYALSHKYVQEQTKNKVFYEPCLPNIADRWKDLYIPIPKDSKRFEDIKKTLCEIVYERQWKYKESIAILKKDYGAYMI
ncbi:MAG: N-6 DNA methylase [Prevotella sp.]|nr:N-6 DNA methylase [Prevotella sp.]